MGRNRESLSIVMMIYLSATIRRFIVQIQLDSISKQLRVVADPETGQRGKETCLLWPFFLDPPFTRARSFPGPDTDLPGRFFFLGGGGAGEVGCLFEACLNKI